MSEHNLITTSSSWRALLKQIAAELAGIVTLIVLASITLYLLPQTAFAARWLWVLLCFVSFSLGFVLITQDHGPCRLLRPIGKGLLALMLLPCFALVYLVPLGGFNFFSILTVVWVAFLPHIMPLRAALLSAVGVVCLWFSWLMYMSDTNQYISALLYGCFHIFVVLMQQQTIDEQRARNALAQKHQELLAAQQLLKSQAAEQERMRIARDLHDTLGHHLTALSIKLELTQHLAKASVASNDAKQQQLLAQLAECHQLAKLLLSDVRDTVSRFRAEPSGQLAELIKARFSYIPELTLNLTIAHDWPELPLAFYHSLLLVIQEAGHNCFKHSPGQPFHVSLHATAEQIELTMWDDGIVSKNWQWGNGLKGLDERVKLSGGSARITTQQGHLHYRICWPINALKEAA